MRRILTIGAFLTFASIGYVQAQLTIGAEFRVRSEYRDGARILMDSTMNPAFVTSQRTRLMTNYQNDRFQIKLTLQNARIWGDDKERANVPNINMAEGWVSYYLSENSKAWMVKIGRQHFYLDDRRIFGLRNWNDIAVSHDLAFLQYQNAGWKVITGGAYNNNSNIYEESPYTVNYYKYLGFFWANKKVNDQLSVSFLTSVDGNEDADDFHKVYSRYTSGFFVKGGDKNSDFDIEASLYYQYGTHTSGKSQKGYLVSVIPSFKINKRLSASAGVNYFSGNSDLDSDDGVNRSFNKLFGDGHRYYGYMDYFLNVEDNTKGYGMQEIFGSLFVKTGKRSELEISYHNFAFAGRPLDPLTSTEAGSQLGNEIDLQFIHKINDFLSARLAYSTMFAQPSMELLKGGDHEQYQQWAMVMLIAKPQLFSNKN